jgi:hypothetical protein
MTICRSLARLSQLGYNLLVEACPRGAQANAPSVYAVIYRGDAGQNMRDVRETLIADDAQLAEWLEQQVQLITRKEDNLKLGL